MTALRLISQRLIAREALAAASPLLALALLAALTWPLAQDLAWHRAFAGLLFLLKGALAHRLSWAIWFEWRPRSFSARWKEQLPYLATAWALSYALIAFQAQREGLGWLVLLGQVWAASWALHGWLLYSGQLEQASKERARERVQEKAQAQVLEVERHGQVHRLPLADLLAVWVDDHYCTLHYRTPQGYASLRVYGRLADFEERSRGQLFRISRSLLVRPEALGEIGPGRNPEVSLEGLDAPVQVARSRKKALLERIGLESPATGGEPSATGPGLHGQQGERRP